MALDFFAGCLGGCAGVLVGHPFDTIKVRLQTQDFKNPIYKGTLDCIKSTIRKESALGLYKGMSSPMAGVAVVNAIVFGVYGNCQRRLSDSNALSSHFLAGAAAGLTQSFICSPMELVKTRLQVQRSSKMAYSGPLDCLVQVARSEGIRGIFKGLGITMMREVPAFGMYFFTYELMTRPSTPTRDGSPAPRISTPVMLLAGGLSGTISWVVTYPVDVVKSRLQADTVGKYRGMLDCLKKSVQTEGFGVLTRGLTSTILRAFPTNAATFTVVTWTFRWASTFQKKETPSPYIVPEVAAPKVQINEVFKNKEDTNVVFRMEYKGDPLGNGLQLKKIVLHDFLGNEMFDSSLAVGESWISTDDTVLLVHDSKNTDKVCEDSESLMVCPQEETNVNEDNLQNISTPVNR